MRLLAGAAIRDITPSGPVTLYGYPHVSRISTGIHDPLLASAIVLQRNESLIVIASLDLLMIEPATARELRRASAAAAGCSESSVFIGCTHTHSGPVTSRLIGWEGDPAVPAPDPLYLQFVKGRLVEAVAAACAVRLPAEIAWATADAEGVGGNRLHDGGATDPECGVLAVRDAGDLGIMAAALIYGMHPTVLHEDSTLVSADFPHYTRLHIAEHLGREIPVVYLNAPCGNQSPRRFVNGQTFAEAERLGRMLGASVCRAVDGIEDGEWDDDPVLTGGLTGAELPRNPIMSVEAAEENLTAARARFRELRLGGAPRAEVRTAECAVFGAESALVLARAAERGVIRERLRVYTPADVQVLMVGDVCLAGLPGELFTEYALTIKHRSPRRTFAVCLVNGDLQGYIVTPEAAADGGYETANAVFAPEAGTVLVETAIALIGRLTAIAGRKGV